MPISLVVTEGFGNGTYQGSVADIVLQGYSSAPAPVCPPQIFKFCLADKLPIQLDWFSVAGDTETISIVWKTRDSSSGEEVVEPVDLTGGIGHFILTYQGVDTIIESEPFTDPTNGQLDFILTPTLSTMLLDGAVKSRLFKQVINFTGNYQTAEETFTQLVRGDYSILARTI